MTTRSTRSIATTRPVPTWLGRPGKWKRPTRSEVVGSTAMETVMDDAMAAPATTPVARTAHDDGPRLQAPSRARAGMRTWVRPALVAGAILVVITTVGLYL